jgi:uncharacterized membrane protein
LKEDEFVMNGTRREWKACAKQALKGNYGSAILGMILVTVITAFGSMFTSALFEGTSLLEVVLSQLFLFILTLIISVFDAGLCYMYLNMARRQAFSMNDLLYFFRNQPDRVIVAGFVLAVIEIIAFLPYYYFSYQPVTFYTIDQQLAWMEQLMVLMLLGLVLKTLLGMPFVLAYYLLADNPEMSGLEALKRSVLLMKGHMWQYLLLQISFLPLLFLSSFTLYIGLLWLIPYMQMTTVLFYMDVTGELILESKEGNSTNSGSGYTDSRYAESEYREAGYTDSGYTESNDTESDCDLSEDFNSEA